MRMNTVFALLLGMAISFSTVAKAQDYKPLKGDPGEINFGLISTESSSALRHQWEPLISAMQKQVGKKVNAFFAPDYAGLIEAMRFGKIHVAWLGNKAAMEAVDRANAEVFVRKTKPAGADGYFSVLITGSKNKSLNSVEDLLKCKKDIDFGLGDPNSTSGFLVPSYYIFSSNGINPRKCFRVVRNANHETNLMAVANNQLTAAVVSSSQIERSKKKVPEAAAKIKVIWKSPLIPSDPIVYRRDLSRDLRNQIKTFFLSFGRVGDTDKAKAILKGMPDPFGLFVDASNSQLYPIRELTLFRAKTKLENDSYMDAAEKKSKLEEIQKKLDLLKVLAANS